MEVSPHQLFETHMSKADRIAERLCWHYRISGALLYQEEARSEARMALWRCCMLFDPSLQALQNKISKALEQSLFWSPIFGFKVQDSRKDPYATFWIWSIQRINGRVLDFFRSQQLIRCLEPGEAHTMLYRNKFVSISNPKGSTASGTSNSHIPSEYMSQDYTDSFFSPDRSDGYNEVESTNLELASIMERADLTPSEREAIQLAYGSDEMTAPEIAEMLGVDTNEAKSLIKKAMSKLKEVAQTFGRGASSKCVSATLAAQSMILPTLPI